MNAKTSRRQFLKIAASALGGASILALGKLLGEPVDRGSAMDTERQFLPLLFNWKETPTATKGSPTLTPTPTITIQPPTGHPRVVHMHSSNATHWDTSDPQFWKYADQNVVNNMMDQGMIVLTGENSISNSWRKLLPNYQPGQGIAIKVNFNNSFNCNDSDGEIDGVIEPVNAVIRGLKQIGVRESDIWIYDAIRAIPSRFTSRCIYGGVQFYDNGCHNQAGWSSNDPHAYISFSPPVGIPMPRSTRITDVLINSAYLINMPIMKKHGIAGLSLGFKHHFGTIDYPDFFHNYIATTGPYFSQNYNILVDIYRNSHVGPKTILTVGDGLFASFGIAEPPRTWVTFGNQLPNSLFFSTDPVAIDCVMADFLEAESFHVFGSDKYLELASNAGLGVFERGDPWGKGYTNLDYLKIDL